MGIVEQIVEEFSSSPHKVLVGSGILIDLYILTFDTIIAGQRTQRVNYQDLPEEVH